MSAVRLESETFSSVDAAWLHMDTPTNLAVINGVLSFDRLVDFERLKATIQSRLLIHRRFRQRVRESEHTFGLPLWEPDPAFDIDAHVLRASLPEPADHRTLQQLMGDLMSEPLDLSKPLWQLIFIDNYQENSALICRLHHCIADGLALIQVLLSMTDLEADTPWPEPVDFAETEPELGRLARLLRPAVKAAMTVGHTWHVAASLAHEGMDSLVHPSRWVDAARFGTSATLALSRLLLLSPDRKTIFRGKCGTSKHAVWSKSIKLDDVKAIGRLMGGTVNDVLLSAVTGALRRYMEQRQEPIEGVNIRAVVPVNLRPPDDTELIGNRFGLVFLSLPIGVRDPLRRLAVLRRRMNALKDSPEAIVAIGILSMAGLSPAQIESIIVAIFGMKGTAVMTNVPGPRQPLYLAGGKIDSMMFWVPTPGNLGLGVSIVSYAGDVILGVTTDESLVPDPEAILDNFYVELEQMKQWGRPPKKVLQHIPSAQSSNHQPPSQPGLPDRCQALTKEGKPCKNHPLPGSTTCRIHS